MHASVCTYDCSVPIPFKGDYSNIRNNSKWNKAMINNSDQQILFADVVNKVNRKDGKVGSEGSQYVFAETCKKFCQLLIMVRVIVGKNNQRLSVMNFNEKCVISCCVKLNNFFKLVRILFATVK